MTPPAITAAAEGASEPIAVDASRGNCTWTAQSGAAWLVLQDVGGVGDGKVTLRVEANTASTPRTGTVTVATQVVSVSQAAAPVVVVEEVRLEGPASQVSGTCPTITFRVEGRLIRTNTATNFGETTASAWLPVGTWTCVERRSQTDRCWPPVCG